MLAKKNFMCFDINMLIYPSASKTNTIDKIRHNAYIAHIELDRALPAYEGDIAGNLAHFDDCIACPVRGLIARAEQSSSAYIAPKFYRNNIRLMLTFPAIKAKREIFNNKFNNELYKRTGKIKKFLIKQKRVVFGKVKPLPLYRLYMRKCRQAFRKFLKKIRA